MATTLDNATLIHSTNGSFRHLPNLFPGGFQGFPGDSRGKEFACNAGDLGLIPGFDPWVRKIPWSRAWQRTPVFLPEEFLWTEESGRL